MKRLFGFLAGLLLVVSASANDITIAWNLSTDTNVVGYRVYYSRVGQTTTNVWQAGKTNITTITNLVSATNVTYRFVCVAVNQAGVESDPTIELLTDIPPHAVKNPRLVGRTDTGFMLTWQSSDETDAKTYRVTYGTVTPKTSNVATVAAPVTFVSLTNNLVPGAEHYFDFTVVNNAGVESWPYQQLRSSLLPSSGSPDLKAVVTLK